MSSHLRYRTDWRRSAACRTEDPELFFPSGTVQVAAARKVCQRCPVESDCLSWALMNGPTYGLWGGTTEAERRALLVLPRLLLIDR